MRRILLGCTLLALGLLLGVQAASAEADKSGPPLSRLVQVPADYAKGQKVATDKVAFILTKDYYEREIYEFSTSPKTKYAVLEHRLVTGDPVWIPAGWYEVERTEPPTPTPPTPNWKYSTRR